MRASLARTRADSGFLTPASLCAVLDLDGVLVKSDWNRERGWRTFKRPGVDAFLKHMAQARSHAAFLFPIRLTALTSFLCAVL